jgi:hypothetical protein
MVVGSHTRISMAICGSIRGVTGDAKGAVSKGVPMMLACGGARQSWFACTILISGPALETAHD